MEVQRDKAVSGSSRPKLCPWPFGQERPSLAHSKRRLCVAYSDPQLFRCYFPHRGTPCAVGPSWGSLEERGVEAWLAEEQQEIQHVIPEELPWSSWCCDVVQFGEMSSPILPRPFPKLSSAGSHSWAPRAMMPPSAPSTDSLQNLPLHPARLTSFCPNDCWAHCGSSFDNRRVMVVSTPYGTSITRSLNRKEHPWFTSDPGRSAVELEHPMGEYPVYARRLTKIHRINICIHHLNIQI